MFNLSTVDIITLNRYAVTDYGEENPLLMDYYGFPKELYKLKFKSKGDTALANRITELYHEVPILFVPYQPVIDPGHSRLVNEPGRPLN